jgi:hypothetical protein
MNRDEEVCEFCGEHKKTASTTFVGFYCIDCHKILIQQSREAIKEIKKQLRRK